MDTCRFCLRLAMTIMLMASCSASEPDTDDAAATAPTSTTLEQPTDAASNSPNNNANTTLSLEPATLRDVLPVVCDFERYNGLHLKADTTQTDLSGYETSLDTFVRLILGDRSLPTDQTLTAQIKAEQARCSDLPSLTFANGSHPVGKQIEATTYRTLMPVQQACSWERKDKTGTVVETSRVEAGNTIEIVVDPTDRSVRIDGCGIFVAGTPPAER